MTDLNKLFQDKMGRPMKYEGKTMTARRSEKLFTWAIWIAIVAFVVLIIMSMRDAEASDRYKTPDKVVINKNDIDKSVNVDSASESYSESNSESDSQSTSDSSADNSISFNAPDNTPPVSPASMFPANPCHMPWSVGLALPGFGGSGGAVAVDENCQGIEWARAAYNFGLRDAAVAKLCSMEQAPQDGTCNAVNDYNKEIANLKAQNELLLEDNLDLAETVKGYCRESNERVHKACAEK